jgi:hypothetical protein
MNICWTKGIEVPTEQVGIKGKVEICGTGHSCAEVYGIDSV